MATASMLARTPPNSKKKLLIGGGLLALLLAIIGGVINSITSKDGKTATVEVPEGSTVKGDGKGKVAVTLSKEETPIVPPVPPDKPPHAVGSRWPLAPSKPEDMAWLRGLNATLTLRTGPNSDKLFKPKDARPAGPATIVGIEFDYNQGGSFVTDEVMKRVSTLVDLESLTCVFVGNNPVSVTKAGLPVLISLTNLRRLNLGRIGPRDTDPEFLLYGWLSFRPRGPLRATRQSFPGARLRSMM